MITREEAFKVLTTHVQSESLIKHSLAVEASMRGYARKFSEDVELFGLTGLLHDIDFEKFPEAHPEHARELLADVDLPEEVIDAILKHGKAEGIKRESLLAKTLFAVDSLSSFVIAYVHVRPGKSFEDIKLKSIKKKFKDKAFARAVNRELVVYGAKELGVDLSDHMVVVIDAIVKRQEELQELGLSLV